MPKYVEDMGFEEFKEYYSRVICDEIIKNGFKNIPAMVGEITRSVMRNNVFGVNRKGENESK